MKQEGEHLESGMWRREGLSLFPFALLYGLYLFFKQGSCLTFIVKKIKKEKINKQTRLGNDYNEDING